MNDLISRQAAIDALKRAEALTRAFGYHNVIDTIRELPSAQPEVLACGSGELVAQPEQRWVPCEERLPEDNTRVLVTFANGFVGTSSWHESTKPFNRGFDNYMNGIKEDYSIIRFGVIAWMPLPEPYKGEGEAEC